MKTAIKYLIAVLLIGVFASTVTAASYYPTYRNYGSYGYNGRLDYGYTPRYYSPSFDFSSYSARNEYWRYQIPSGTGYVFSPGYYNGPRYFSSFPGRYSTLGYRPFGSYSSRNNVYPYQYVPYWS